MYNTNSEPKCKLRTVVNKDALIRVHPLREMHHTKSRGKDFPGGPVVKNQPPNVGDEGSVPGQVTKIPQATKQLNLCATTRRIHAPQ